MRISWHAYGLPFVGQGRFAGAVFKILSCLAFAGINIALKGLKGMPEVQIACLESAGAACLLWPWVKRSDALILRKGMFWLRLLFALAGTLAWIVSMCHCRLVQSIMVGFLGPFVTIIGAWLFMNERMNLGRLVSIFCAFLGGVMLHCPKILNGLGLYTQLGSKLHTVSWQPIAASVAFAIANLMGKGLLATTSVLGNTFFFFVITTAVLSLTAFPGVGDVVSMIPGLGARLSMHWVMPSLSQGAVLMGLMMLTALAQVTMHKAMACAPLTFLLPLGAIRILVTVLLGWIVWHEHPTFIEYMGMMMIALAWSVLIWSEGKLQ